MNFHVNDFMLHYILPWLFFWPLFLRFPSLFMHVTVFHLFSLLYSIPLYAKPQFVYLFFCSWRFGLFSILGYQTMLFWTFCQLQCKLLAGRDFACFVWSCLLRHSRCLEQCRADGRCSVNIWRMNEFLYMSPGAHVQDLLQGSCFQSMVQGPLGPLRPFQGVCEDKIIFIKILNIICPFHSHFSWV